MKPLTIYVVPSDAVGHINACMGTTRGLLRRGHRVIFLTEEAFRGKVACHGFEEHNYAHKFVDSPVPVANKKADDKMKPGEKMARDMLKNRIIGPYPLEEKIKQMIKYFRQSSTAKDKLVSRDKALREAIKLYDPDVFLVDKGYLEPALYYSGKPWICNFSFSPVCFTMSQGKENTKPAWQIFDGLRDMFQQNASFHETVESLGYAKYAEANAMPQTQILTVYAFPDELNSVQVGKLEGWFNLEVFDRNATCQEATSLKECVPTEFVNDTLNGQFSGKYIYLSLGSMGSVDVDLMNRLVRILASTKHKVIVSKGPRHEEFELASNMWGGQFLAQTKIVPLVDLVITHGGNNTVTETFATGKPMIVLPLFGDQFVNAMQIDESGLGVSINPYEFEDQQLLAAVDRLLKDKPLNDKLRNAAQRIKSGNAHERLCDKIEALLSGLAN